MPKINLRADEGMRLLTVDPMVAPKTAPKLMGSATEKSMNP